MDDLGTLMRQAVETVEPSDRRAELREQVAVASRRRRRRNAATGGLLAAAVVVTGITVAAHQHGHSEPDPIGPPRAIDRGKHHPAYGIYDVGDTPLGLRLYREFRVGPDAEKSLDDAISLLGTAPVDPDYTTYWSTAQLLGAEQQDDVIAVDVDPAVTGPADAGPRPDLALQQVIYTVQGVTGTRLPIQFVHDGNPVAEVFGLPTSEPLVNAPQLDVLALASISDPSDRRVVDDEFSANGVASSFEGSVPWELDAPDGTVVRSGTAETYGWEDHLYPWATGQIDVSDLPAGDYTFVVRTDDPSGGEGPGPTEDTRTVIIQ
jgi:Immunoglobulin-like domain of bacterial spore germination